MKFQVRRLEILIEYILALLLVLSCNSVFLHSINDNYHILDLIIVFSIILSGVLSFRLKINKKTFNKIGMFFSVYYIYIFTFLLIWSFHSGRRKFILNFVIFVPIMTYCYFCYNKRMNSYSLLYKISDIVLLLTWVSLVLWISASLLNIIKPTGYMNIFWGKEVTIPSYFNLYFETQTINFFGFSGIRNTGVFCEGTMYSIVLVISLAIEFFLREKVNKRRCLLFIIGVISTISTTGVISVLIIISLKMFLIKNKNRTNENRLYNIIRFILIIFAIVGFIYIGYQILYEKQSSSSYSIRLDDYIAGYKAWIKSPIVGNGYGSIDSIRAYMSSWRSYNTGFSNGIMIVLAQSGIALLLIYILPGIFYLSESIRIKKMNLLCIFIIILELFITSFWQDTNLLLLFISFGLSLILKENY